ncbi:hypothetical protein EJB05_34544, partial [Eragrostis curvula]
METNDQLTPPAIAAVAGEVKRPRKRSRYLSPPYTDADDAPAGEVCAADVLSALRGAALLSLDSQQIPNTAQALRFLALYRNSRSSASTLSANPLLEDADAPAAGVGPKPLLKLSIPAMSTPAPGPTKKKQNPQQPPATPAPAIRKDNAAAAAPPEAGQKRASKSEGGNASAKVAVNAKRKRKYKKMMNNTGNQQVQHFGNPVALVLDFAEGTPLPSTDDLLSTFSKFGFLIQSETAILKEDRSARVVFATRAEAEAAYSCAQTLGAFGPPFATTRLQDLPPITLNAPPPLPNLPLKDVRKNLEMMISSLTGRSSSFAANAPQGAKPAMGNLVGEMQGLLAKVDKMLQGASSTVHHD